MIDEGRGHVPRTAFLIASEGRNLGPLDLAGDHRFPQDGETASQQALRAYLLLDMDLDARQQRRRLQQPAHEAYLVYRLAEKEFAERDEAPLGEIAPAVTV